ncbi:unnamed protein product [Pleuronectes platessa]|uniref:Uncharacterized protein n=1 Tax=Pleuronectes platessa TaxID=8262 RepID=A0A9N7VRU1_PLEPL|nr:unnamed protein product [Pleuronectes platessa]
MPAFPQCHPIRERLGTRIHTSSGARWRMQILRDQGRLHVNTLLHQATFDPLTVTCGPLGNRPLDVWPPASLLFLFTPLKPHPSVPCLGFCVVKVVDGVES